MPKNGELILNKQKTFRKILKKYCLTQELV
jgi:hypothetical protein